MAMYNELPIRLFKGKKNVTVEIDTPESGPDSTPLPPDLQTEIDQLNKTYASFVRLDNHESSVPPPPTTLSPARAAHVNDMRVEANKLFAAGDYEAAVKNYSLAIRMSSGRPPWEMSQVVRTELVQLYGFRSQAYIELGRWPEGLADALSSAVLMKEGNVQSWGRVIRCLGEMGRLAEAREYIIQAMALYPNDRDLEKLKQSVLTALERGEKFVWPDL